MVKLSNKKLCTLLIPAIAVVAGVMLKNGGKQYMKSQGKKEDNNLKMIGMALFIGGWIGVAWAASINDKSCKKGPKFWLPILSSVSIVVAVIVMMQAKEKYGDKSPNWVMVFVAMFAIGWIALGYSVAMGKGNTAMTFGLGASGLVLVSMLGSLPWQRKNSVVDGPGMALFALAWVSLAVANSM